MTPGIYSFPNPLKRGDTFNGHQFEVLLNSVPVNFTGAVVKIQARRVPGSKVILEWTTANGGITISGASNNIINMETKTGLQMEVEPGTYMFDLNVVLSNGVTNTYVEGTFIIKNDISR